MSAVPWQDNDMNSGSIAKGCKAKAFFGGSKKAPKGPRALLEPNHSHFLFVDAGPEAEGQFGKEIALRAAMEDALCWERPGDDLTTAHIAPDRSRPRGTLLRPIRPSPSAHPTIGFHQPPSDPTMVPYLWSLQSDRPHPIRTAHSNPPYSPP